MPSSERDEWADYRGSSEGIGFTPIPEQKEDDGWDGYRQAMSVANAGPQFSAGVAEGAGGLGGMLKGASLAAKLPLPGAAKAVTTVVGGITGLFAGSAAVGTALELVGVPKPEQLPEEQRPTAFTARSLGSALPFVAAPFVAASRGVVLADQGVGKLANRIIQTAKTQPKTFAAVEISSAATAAAAAGVAEQVAPGETGIRIGAELAGGILAPANTSIRAYRSLSKVAKGVISKMSPASRETMAARQLQELLAHTGEDPSILVNALKTNHVLDPHGAVLDETLTSAQKTQSEALGALQKYLSDNNPNFKASLLAKEQDSLSAMRGMIDLLGKTGDPTALATAAEMKSQYVRTILQSMVDDKLNEATIAAKNISADSAAARPEISAAARTALEDVILEVRKAESRMWDEIPADVSAEVGNLQTVYRNFKAETVPELADDKLPKIVSQFLDRISVKTGDATPIAPGLDAKGGPFSLPTASVGDLKQIRSHLLDDARELTNAGKFGKARVYNDLANSILDDMDAAFMKTHSDAYNAARMFTKEMHDVFTRSFVGKVTATDKYGARVAPELTLRKALATGKEAADINFQQLEDATRFLDVKGVGNEVTAESTKIMLDGQERFVRLMFTSAVDPNTGLVNPTKLKGLMRENEVLLNRFPEIKTQLDSALTSEGERRAISDWVAGKLAHVEKIKMLEKLTGSDPVLLSQRALTSPDMPREVRKLVSMTKGGSVVGFSSTEAMEGLSSAMFSAVRRKSLDATGNLSLDRYKALLSTPATPGGPTPLDVLVKEGVISLDHKKLVTQVFDTLDSLASTKTPGSAVTIHENTSDVALGFLSRVAGTTLVGTAAKSLGTGASIQAHAAGANLANYLVNKLTSVKMDDIFIRALNDKDFMVTLLQKVDTPQKAEIQARQINAWLFQSGVGFATSDEEETQ